MRMLCARSKNLIRLFHSCNRDVLIELGRSVCCIFTAVVCGQIVKEIYNVFKIRVEYLIYCKNNIKCLTSQ